MTRFGYLMLAYFAAMGTAAAAFVDPVPRLIWNASASVPVGLYALRKERHPPVGALVLVKPPTPLSRFLAERHYLPLRVPMLKHVAALAGQRVCRSGTLISIDGKPVGEARVRDRQGRPLPAWSGCRLLTRGQVFLMNRDVSDSLDGRYFGPIPARTVIGKATPIYTDEAGDGRFVWRAQTSTTSH